MLPQSPLPHHAALVAPTAPAAIFTPPLPLPPHSSASHHLPSSRCRREVPGVSLIEGFHRKNLLVG
ncbi:unnamed protein product, partial [Linum tenue]